MDIAYVQNMSYLASALTLLAIAIDLLVFAIVGLMWQQNSILSKFIERQSTYEPSEKLELDA